MSSRYSYTNTIRDVDTNEAYMESTIYPRIKANDNDFYVISEASDRIDLLAKKYYNDVSLWWVIAVANNLNNGDFFVKPGLQLRIPSDITRITNDLSKVNR